MRYYELLAAIPAQLTDTEIQAVSDRIAAVLATAGTEVLRVENLGKVKFAYPVKKLRHAVYVLTVFKAESKAIAVIQAALIRTDGVLRSVISETTEAALTRPVQLTSYQEPIVERDRDRDDGRSRTGRSAGNAEVTPVAVPVGPTLSSEDVDKQIEKILDEKVL